MKEGELSQCGHFSDKEGEVRSIFRYFVRTSFIDGRLILIQIDKFSSDVLSSRLERNALLCLRKQQAVCHCKNFTL